MSNAIGKLINDKKLIRKLEKCTKKAAKSIQRKAIRSAAGVMKKAIKAEMPVDTGAARKAIDYKVTSKGGGAIIGAKADYEQEGRKPANYIHLIEYGHIAPDGTVVPGKHPIERGAKASEGAVARQIEDKTRSELDKLL